ncbi:MAG: DUF4129 domain-containing protein [Planctomycetales bacterium]
MMLALCIATLAPWPQNLQRLSPGSSLHAQEAVVDDESVRRELDEILEHPDFRRLRLELNPPEVRTPWIERFFNWLADLFRPVNAPSVSWIGDAFRVFAYAVIGVIACGIIWLIVKAVNSWRALQREKIAGIKAFEEGTAELPPGDLPADEYLRRARELSGQGLYGEAIAQLLLGAMSATERSGLIRFRRGLTYRDYVRALRQQPEPCQSFRTMVSIYLPIGFGRRSAVPTQFDEALAAYEAAFARALTPAVAKPTAMANSTANAAEPDREGSAAVELPGSQPDLPRESGSRSQE